MNTLFFNMVVNDVRFAHIYIKANEELIEIKDIIKKCIYKSLLH